MKRLLRYDLLFISKIGRMMSSAPTPRMGEWMPGAEGRLCHVVFEWIESRLQDPFSLAGLPEVEADLLGTVTAFGVICNGGHVYWYEGKSGEDTLRVAAGFERMELPEAAEALRRSLTSFPGGAPPRDLADRQRYVSEHQARLKEAFAPLDQIVWDVDFDAAAVRHILRHREELLAANPSLGAELRRYEDAHRTLVEGLRRASLLLDEPERSECARMIERSELKSALQRLIGAGHDQGAGFWRTLAEVAELLLGENVSSTIECQRWVRVAKKGALLVEGEFVPTAKLGRAESNTSYLSGHKLRWNAGHEPAGLLRSAAAELFLVGQHYAGLGERSRLFLVPAGRRSRGLSKGAPIVLHEKGEIVGRAVVIESRAPRA